MGCSRNGAAHFYGVAESFVNRVTISWLIGDDTLCIEDNESVIGI